MRVHDIQVMLYTFIFVFNFSLRTAKIHQDLHEYIYIYTKTNLIITIHLQNNYYSRKHTQH